jgi:hypothetical protein
MKIFGLSLTSLFILLGFFWLGTRFPNAFGSLPLLGK